MSGNSWTADEIAELRRYLELEYSPYQISQMIGNHSRNSVIGKAWRLGLRFSGRPRRMIPLQWGSPATLPLQPLASVKPQARETPGASSLEMHPTVSADMVGEVLPSVPFPQIPRYQSKPTPTVLVTELVRRPRYKVVLGASVTAQFCGDPPPGRSALGRPI
jgi:hypothetical protein